MGAAERRRGLGALQRALHERHQELLVGQLVREDVALETHQQRARRGEVAVQGGQSVGDRADLLDDRQDGIVLGPQPPRGLDVRRCHGDRVERTREDGAQGDADGEHVDHLLGDRADRGRQEARRRDDHRGEREAHAHQDRLRAIAFDRRAIRIASARASTRSTVSTTSAASDDAVAPRDASATPTPAAASAGASLMPSPTMMVGPLRTRARWRRACPAGSHSASTVSTPTTRPTISAMSDRSPVTRTILVMPPARSAAPCGARRVGSRPRAGTPPRARRRSRRRR